MVRSGERPGSAPADWLASQNDSFTVALDHCVPFYCPFYNKAADDADIALLTILQHATTVAISLQRSSRPRCGPRCGPHLKDNHDVVRHTKQDVAQAVAHAASRWPTLRTSLCPRCRCFFNSGKCQCLKFKFIRQMSRHDIDILFICLRQMLQHDMTFAFSR